MGRHEISRRRVALLADPDELEFVTVAELGPSVAAASSTVRVIEASAALARCTRSM